MLSVPFDCPETSVARNTTLELLYPLRMIGKTEGTQGGRILNTVRPMDLTLVARLSAPE